MQDQFIIGLDGRLDRGYRMHYWRMVIWQVGKNDPSWIFYGSIPRCVKYIHPPVDAIRGDLRELGTALFMRMPEIQLELLRKDVSSLTISSCHQQSGLINALQWNGVAMNFQNVPEPDVYERRDPFGLGGQAGHEIAHLHDIMQQNLVGSL